MDKTEELNGGNTIFGKVRLFYPLHKLNIKIVGDTLYNLLKIGESEVDENERPLYPTKIISVDVMHNPFDDIIPRITPEERKALAEEERKKKELAEKEKRPKGKKCDHLFLSDTYL